LFAAALQQTSPFVSRSEGAGREDQKNMEATLGGGFARDVVVAVKDYYQPLANVAFDIGHNLTAKVGWDYYQYGEGSFVGPTDPRYFHANNATFSLRWAF
jgi:hypothetical protein